jgi:hypothetical protein
MNQSAPASVQSVGQLTAEDRLDIHQLIAQYSYYEDNGNAEAWAALFTVDGRFVGSGDKLIIGRDNLIEFARRRWEDKPQVRDWLHWVSNVVIRPTADGAEADSYHMTIEKRADGHAIGRPSGKSDEFRRENGEWRFHVRRVVTLPFQ